MLPAQWGVRTASPWRGHGVGSGAGSREGAGKALSLLGFGAMLGCLLREGFSIQGDLNCCVQFREESVTAGSVLCNYKGAANRSGKRRPADPEQPQAQTQHQR